jgi:hypothetical protein
MQLIRKLVDPRDRLHVLDHILIQILVVHAHPHGYVLILYQHN